MKTSKEIVEKISTLCNHRPVRLSDPGIIEIFEVDSVEQVQILTKISKFLDPHCRIVFHSKEESQLHHSYFTSLWYSSVPDKKPRFKIFK